MGQVAVIIAGRAYRMACEDGEEEHLKGLGARLDAAMAKLRESFGEIGDQRLAVMAGVTLADELAEAERRLAAAEQARGEAEAALALSRAEAATLRADFARTLNDTAARVEGFARALGQLA